MGIGDCALGRALNYWLRFPLNFPALNPGNFSARLVKWIVLVDPDPRSNTTHCTQ